MKQFRHAAAILAVLCGLTALLIGSLDLIREPVRARDPLATRQFAPAPNELESTFVAPVSPEPTRLVHAPVPETAPNNDHRQYSGPDFLAQAPGNRGQPPGFGDGNGPGGDPFGGNGGAGRTGGGVSIAPIIRLKADTAGQLAERYTEATHTRPAHSRFSQ